MHDPSPVFRPLLPRAHLLYLWLVGFCFACGSEPDDAALGALTLGLTTKAAGVSYHLTDARFTLSGPSTHELASGADSELSVPLPSGAYQLRLHDGYALTRVDGDGTRTPARLVSPNPMPLIVTAGETTRATLRFALADGLGVTVGAGTLQVGVEVGDAGAAPADAPLFSLDATVPLAPALDEAAHACRAGLRISEIDYEQPSSDDAEFVEIHNPGTCEARLSDLQVELVNGTGGKVYGRYVLADAAATLAAGERMVLGDAPLLARLPTTLKQLPLRGAGLQNGPDGVRLVEGEEGAHVLDAVAYKGAVQGSGEGQPTAEDDGVRSLARCPDGHDSDENARDFQATPPSPGAANTCTRATASEAARDAGTAAAPGAQNTSATMPSSSSQR